MDSNSIWEETTSIPARGKLMQKICADTVVIGAGMAGILTAYALKEKGVEVVVLEAAKIGNGQTGHTTAKITSQHGLIYAALIQRVGMEEAKQYADANQQAIEQYEQIIRKMDIACGFRRCPAYLYTTADTEALEAEAKAAERLGIKAMYTKQTELPFKVTGAVRFEEQACFHPLQFLERIAAQLTIYEGSPVKTVEKDRVITDCGEVKARHIVFASHYPFLNMPGYYFMRMHQERSYVLAIKGVDLPEGMYIGTNAEGLSFRAENDLLLLGGGKHRTGENRDGGQYKRLQKQASGLFPNSEEVAHWSAQDAITLDQVPYIGRFCVSRPNWYVATGFGKWGMTSSMAAAGIISDLITERENPYKAVFSPQRAIVPVSAKAFLKDSLHAMMDLSRQVLMIPKEKLEKLPPGQGGIVEYDGEKAGVYKEENGTLHVVSTRCPHLGCQLAWNPEEKSWDCPCHGSRFDYRGHLLNNPAQEDIPYEA